MNMFILACLLSQGGLVHAAESEQKVPVTVKAIEVPVVTLESATKAHLLADSFQPLRYLYQVPSEVRKFYGSSITGEPSKWQQGCVRYAGSRLVEKLFVVGAKSDHLVIVLHKTSGYGIFESWDLFERRGNTFQFVRNGNLPLKSTLCTSANQLIAGVRHPCTKADSLECIPRGRGRDTSDFKVRFGSR